MDRWVNGERVAMTADEIAAWQAESAAVPAERRRVAKSLVLSRLTDAQLDAALTLMTARQKERWRAADQPTVFADDPETVGLLQAVGADPVAVLAPA